MYGAMIVLKALTNSLELWIIDSLEGQNHIATGKLRDSVKVAVKRESDGWFIEGQYLYYGKFVEKGRKAGGKKVPIDVLVKWIRDKKINLRGRKARSVAFMIQNAIFKKGIPTDGDERKKRFVGKVLDDKSEVINAMIQESITIFYSIEIKELIKKYGTNN